MWMILETSFKVYQKMKVVRNCKMKVVKNYIMVVVIQLFWP